MTNKEISNTLKLYHKLMELHGANPFKIKAYANAVFQIPRLDQNLTELSQPEMEKIKGIGKGLAEKIQELISTGEIVELNDLIQQTPAGIIEIMSVKGVGPKKIATLWKDFGIESIGELQQACEENRLIQLKGFGEKLQKSILENLKFLQSNKNKVLYPIAEEIVNEISKIALQNGKQLISLGQFSRKCQIIEKLELGLIATPEEISVIFKDTPYSAEIEGNLLILKSDQTGLPISILCKTELKKTEFLARNQSSSVFLEQLDSLSPETLKKFNEGAFPPELMEDSIHYHQDLIESIDNLVDFADLKGILHNHSTYSDGANTLREMAEYCKELGFEYLGISDHSQTAFYANGLTVDRVLAQHKEIEDLNKEFAPFKIFKGIESDILMDGSLDYTEEILKSFDFIVASVHFNLNMDEEKATNRLLKAIENPYTTILGHPTGRLLLAREGYPINHKMIIDSCAKHGVTIELNSNPKRLDLDWKWISYAQKMGVKIAINPDAHRTEGYLDMHYGVGLAKKGALLKRNTLNALDLNEFETYLKKRNGKAFQS
ncbi:MAG: DNA polymerase (family 10) [Sphingobacteriales bacterium]|jgi:DNA polymerase (family 10)